MIRATRGQVVEGRRLLKASLATFEAAGCTPDGTLVGYALALTAGCEHEAGRNGELAEQLAMDGHCRSLRPGSSCRALALCLVEELVRNKARRDIGQICPEKATQ